MKYTARAWWWGLQGPLNGEITNPRSGLVNMRKEIVAGVGICGCITSFQPFENISEKMGHFGGMSGHLGAVVGAPTTPG